LQQDTFWRPSLLRGAIHVTDHQNGPLMWSQLKAAFSHTNSAACITHLEALLTGQQGSDESISSLIAHLSEHWQSFVNAQPTGFNLNTLNEELFCWSLIRQLDPLRYADLQLSLIKEKDLTKSSAVSLATNVESGLLSVSLPDSAFNAHSPGPPASATSAIIPCKWCISKGRTEIAKTHTLEQCTGLDKHLEDKPKSKPKQLAKTAAVQGFAGEASSSNSFSDSPADNYWIADSGAMSNMTSHKEWIVDYVPLCVPIHLGDHSVVYSAGVGNVWIEPMLSGHPAPLVSLSRVLHVPHLKSNLLSITYLSVQQKVKVSFIENQVVFEKHGGIIFNGTITGQGWNNQCSHFACYQGPQTSIGSHLLPT